MRKMTAKKIATHANQTLDCEPVKITKRTTRERERALHHARRTTYGYAHARSLHTAANRERAPCANRARWHSEPSYRVAITGESVRTMQTKMRKLIVALMMAMLATVSVTDAAQPENENSTTLAEVPNMHPQPMNRTNRRAAEAATRRHLRRVARWHQRVARWHHRHPQHVAPAASVLPLLAALALCAALAMLVTPALLDALPLLGLLGRAELVVQTKSHNPICKICRGRGDTTERTPVANIWSGQGFRKWVHVACAREARCLPVTDRGNVVAQPDRADWDIEMNPTRTAGMAPVKSPHRVAYLIRDDRDGDDLPDVPDDVPDDVPAETDDERAAREAREAAEGLAALESDFGEATPAGAQLWHLIGPAAFDAMQAKFADLAQGIREEFGGEPRPTILAIPDENIRIELGVVHEQFDLVLNLCRVRDAHGRHLNVLLVGPAGTGKTHMMAAVAKALAEIGPDAGGWQPDTPREITVISCNAEMSPFDLLGPMVPNVSDGTERYRKAPSVGVYENGGLLIWDEMDALDDNAAVSFNAALAGDTLPLPDGTYATRHPDFVFIGIANTYGDGRSQQYTARNQLDGAFMDRFAGGIVDVNYSPSIERLLCEDPLIREALLTYRERMVAAGIRRIISTRSLMNAAAMKASGLFTTDEALDAVFRAWTDADMQRIERSRRDEDGTAHTAWLGVGLSLLMCEPLTFAVALLAALIMARMAPVDGEGIDPPTCADCGRTLPDDSATCPRCEARAELIERGIWKPSAATPLAREAEAERKASEAGEPAPVALAGGTCTESVEIDGTELVVYLDWECDCGGDDPDCVACADDREPGWEWEEATNADAPDDGGLDTDESGSVSLVSVLALLVWPLAWLVSMARGPGIISTHATSTVVDGDVIEDLASRTHLLVARSVPDLLDAVSATEGVHDIRSFDTGWLGRDGISGLPDAVQGCQEVYEPDMVTVREMAAGLEAAFDEAGIIAIHRPKVNHETRGRVSARRLLLGEPRYRRGRKPKSHAGSGICTLAIDIGGNCNISADVLFWRAAVGVAACDALEARGYRVQLWGCWYSVGAYTTGDDALMCWQVKAAEEPLNIGLAASALSAWFFRTVGFASMWLSGSGQQPTGGLGSSRVVTDGMMRAVTGDPLTRVITANHGGDAKTQALESCLNVLRGFGAIADHDHGTGITDSDDEWRERARREA